MGNVLNKSYRKNMLAAALLLLAAFLCHEWNPMDDSVKASLLFLVRHLIHVSLAMAWCYTMQARIFDRFLRRCLTGIGGMIVFFLLIRTVKWEFLPIGTTARLFWYLYYIPMLLIPYICILLVQYITDPEKMRRRRKFYLILLFLVLGGILLVLSNDLHRLVFQFPGGIALYDANYTYGIAYYVIMAWIYCAGLYATLMLIYQSRVPGSRAGGRYTVLFMLAAIIFWFVNSLRLIRVDFVAVSCIFIVLILESAIQRGLIPSNMGYQEAFRHYLNKVWIAGFDHQVHYASESAHLDAEKMTAAVMEQADEGPVIMKDCQVTAKSITGGHVYWENDISRVQKMIEQLSETREHLEENNDLLQAEANLKKQQIRIREQTRLYETIAENTGNELRKMEQLRRKIQQNPEFTENGMRQICILGAFIKRYSNLRILAEDQAEIAVKELEISLREYLEYIKMICPAVSLDSRVDGTAGSDAVCNIFLDSCREIAGEINKSTHTGTMSEAALFVRLRTDGDQIRVRILTADDHRDLAVKRW